MGLALLSSPVGKKQLVRNREVVAKFETDQTDNQTNGRKTNVNSNLTKEPPLWSTAKLISGKKSVWFKSFFKS